MITHTVNGVIRPRVAVTRTAAPDSRLDEAIVLRRCALQRKAFRGTAVSYPAEVLRYGAVAEWITEHGLTLDVASAGELDQAKVAGVKASRVVMHCHGPVSIPICRAALARFVVDSGEQVACLSDNPLARTAHVVVDAVSSNALAAEVLSHKQLNLAGLHYRLENIDAAELPAIVTDLIARMAWISRKHAVVLSRLSLGDVDVTGCDGDVRCVRRIAKSIDQAVEDGCIRFRFPRPALTVSPRRSVLLPG
jgi:pyridoxal-dependent decarboxylase-like protein